MEYWLDRKLSKLPEVLLFIVVLVEKTVSFAKWCWGSIIGSLVGTVISAALTAVFLGWALTPTHHPRAFTYLTLSGVIATTVFVWRLALAIKSPEPLEN